MRKAKQLLLGGLMALTAGSASAATFVGGRTDFRDETIYFAMTTRFYDGDPSNNTYCWDGVLNVNDPEWRGDFKGLIEKLDYIKALGFTAVWITPVVENASGLDYHGYHAIDFSKVDPRYESTDCKFQDVIDAAHERGMKIILDIVLQHTGNFGEEYLCPMFSKDYTQPLSNINKSMKLHESSKLPSNYFSLKAKDQYESRLGLMKNTRGKNEDTQNLWHHYAHFNWDNPTRWWGQIAGDCVDLNTENPKVTNYLVDCYSKFIEMGVDGFRIDTGGHIARLSFNKAFIPQLHEAAERVKAKRGGTPFYMYTEVCARAEEVIYRGENYNCSPCFYTWKETKDYAWDYSETSWNDYVVMEGETGDHVNAKSVLQQGDDYMGKGSMLKSNNAWLNGNDYRKEDYTQSSGLNVIDFPMHWRFHSAENAFGVRSEDDLYNDARWNVVYVDSHDYGPNGNDKCRFWKGEQAWAENLALMFSWRGIPCIYYGSEIEFRAGEVIDKGPDMALKDGGRAYFGGYIEGSVNVSDFATYTNATGNMAATLSHPLAQHIQRLNKIRAAVPALRKGQYSTDGCSGKMAFKRRYVDDTTDSYALVTVSGGATFTGVLNGTYIDAVTGDKQTVTDGKLTASCSGAGNMRVYVLSTSKTPAPGKVGQDGKYLYDSAPAVVTQLGYDGNEEPLDTETVKDNEAVTPGPSGDREEPNPVVEPALEEGEQAIFFEHSSWNPATVWIWDDVNNYTGGNWPGESLTYLGNNVYKWVYTGAGTIPTDANIIFSNSGNNQVPGMDQGGFKFVNGGYYNTNGYVKTIEVSGEDAKVTLSPNGGTFVGSVTVTAKANSKATSAWYKVGEGAQTTISGSATFTIGADMQPGQSVTVTWGATGATGTKTGSATFTKVEKPAETTVTIYFDNRQANWGKVHAYFYGGELGEIGGVWPGAAMTLDSATGYYAYSFTTDKDATTTNVIFNNGGGGSQTGDNVKVRNGGIYNASGDTGESGIESVASEGTDEAIYYNLQGIRVANPAHGFYIVKRGATVSRVYIP